MAKLASQQAPSLETGRYLYSREVANLGPNQAQGVIVDGDRVYWSSNGQLLTQVLPAGPRQLLLPISFPSPPLRVALAPDGPALAVLRTTQLVEFYSVPDAVATAYAKKAGKLLGLHWLSGDTLLLVSDSGLELLQYAGRRVKQVKEARERVGWYRHASKVVLLGTAREVVSYVCKAPARLERLARAQVELRPARSGPLLPAEAYLLPLYQRLYFIYVDSPAGELQVHQVTNSEIIFKRKLSFLLGATSGRVGLSVVDQLLVVHNLDARISLIFDLKDPATMPLVAPLPMVAHAPAADPYNPAVCEWREGPYAVITPLPGASGAAVVVELQVEVSEVAGGLDEHERKLLFLLRRAQARVVVYHFLRKLLHQRTSLLQLSALFDLINAILAKPSSKRPSLQLSSSDSTGALLALSASQLSLSLHPPSPRAREAHPERRNDEGYIVLEQEDLYSHLFLPMEEDSQLPAQYMIGVLMEYIRSLNYHKLPVQHPIHELLISLLIHNKRFNQLHQFLQYHVLADSGPVAFQLLKLESVYAPAYQLALDMLKRLGSVEQIVEVLLSRAQVLPALRVLKANPQTAKVSPLRFLDVAHQVLLARNDSTIYYTVYSFFLARHDIPMPGYEKYAEIFQRLFGPTSAVITAESNAVPKEVKGVP